MPHMRGFVWPRRSSSPRSCSTVREAHIRALGGRFRDVPQPRLVGARDWTGAHSLERELTQWQNLNMRHGETTRLVGVAAARAISAIEWSKHKRAPKRPFVIV